MRFLFLTQSFTTASGIIFHLIPSMFALIVSMDECSESNLNHQLLVFINEPEKFAIRNIFQSIGPKNIMKVLDKFFPETRFHSFLCKRIPDHNWNCNLQRDRSTTKILHILFRDSDIFVPVFLVVGRIGMFHVFLIAGFFVALVMGMCVPPSMQLPKEDAN